MNEALIAGRYTKAMFALAERSNALEAVKNDMEYLYEVFQISKPFQILLDNPLLKPSQKTKIFREVFTNLNNISLSTVELIFKNRREEILPFVALDFIDKYYRYSKIERVTIKTAAAISKENLERISKLLVDKLNKEVILSTEVDPAILGGFVLRISDKEIDASVRRRLNKFQQQLLQAQIK
jgi:F-type H+-transporting ATPase subunit delta